MTSSIYDLAISQAACQLLVETIPGLVPNTTLNMPPSGSLVGATSVTVHATTGFLVGNIAIWLDGSGEEPLPVLSVVGSVVTFDFTGQSYSGLQHAHADGAMIATNILDDLPLDESADRRNGYPVIHAFVVKKKTPLSDVQDLYQQFPVLKIWYQLTQKQAAGSQLPARLWARQQTHRAVTDVQSIVNALTLNSELITTQNTALIQSVSVIDQDLRLTLSKDGSMFYTVPIEAQLRGQYQDLNP